MVTRGIRATDNIDELVDMGRDRLMIWGARTDALYGLVGLMERAWRNTGRLTGDVLYLYGAHDQIIPARPSRQAARRMPAGARSAYYAEGHHLLLVDRQAERVWRDVAAYLRDPRAPLPSGAPPLRGTRVVGRSSPSSGGRRVSGVERRTRAP
jgi:alpha-beta hydrolase superfamily lysophospholipase